MFPELLQLTTLDDYKEPVTSLLAKLVDSGYIKASQYESWYNKFYFDARIALKKQQAQDETKMESDHRKDEEDMAVVPFNNKQHTDALDQYAVLLIPFYDQNPGDD